jgi:hypothetical protein
MSMLHITADRLTTPVSQGASLWNHFEAFTRTAGRSLYECWRRIRERNEMMTRGELELRDDLLKHVKIEAIKWFWRALVRCTGHAGGRVSYGRHNA